MKISSHDFISLENAAVDAVRDAQAARLNDYAYGLLPTNHPEIDNYPKLVYDYVNNVLILKECRALTPAGQRVEITEANHERRKFPAQLPSVAFSVLEPGRYDVYLHVDPAVRVGAGEFAQNNPPRHVAVSPKYELAVKPHDAFALVQENFLKISELEVREGRVDILTSSAKYIPPCTTLSAFAGLLRLHANGEELLNGLLQHYSNLVNRVGVESRNELADEAMGLTEKMVAPIVSSLSYYRYVLPLYAPLFTVVYFKDLARSIRFQLDRPFRAEIINQYKPEVLESATHLERTEPQHAAILASFDKVMHFLDRLDLFLSEVSKYNYNNRTFDLYDHNQFAPIQRQPASVVVEAPVKETPPPPVEPRKAERIF